MANKRRPRTLTTAAQRRLLFETWEATGNVTVACKRAQVENATFCYWKPRFLAGGYDALASFRSSAPLHPPRVTPEVEQRVIDLHRQHPDWSSPRLAGELASANNGVPLVSASTVKRILWDAGLWTGRVPYLSDRISGQILDHSIRR